jgi:hypothetical protein
MNPRHEQLSRPQQSDFAISANKTLRSPHERGFWQRCYRRGDAADSAMARLLQYGPSTENQQFRSILFPENGR